MSLGKEEIASDSKSDGMRHVPWFSLAEWHEVYKQIYSNDAAQQVTGYERLLVWKARVPKLPVGVDCTLSIIEVCLRDRELTPKIVRAELAAYYENDLSLMYSTTIMRFLNHITNIRQTKQSSLFNIAKQLKIPQWIVNLRHDVAHGSELPAVSVLRIAANILLEWLHEEYWAAESKAIEAYVAKKTAEEKQDESCSLRYLIELWTATGLYIHAGYESIESVPDLHLKDVLDHYGARATGSPRDNKANSSSKKKKPTELSVAQNVLLSEISSKITSKKSINDEENVVNILLEGDSFLASRDVLDLFGENADESESLPFGLVEFWESFVKLMHEKDMLEELVLRLLKNVNEREEGEQRRLLSSFWLKEIASALCRIKSGQKIKHKIEMARGEKRKKISSGLLSTKVASEVDRKFPHLKSGLSLNFLCEIPSALTNVNFAAKIVRDADELSQHFVPLLLELVAPPFCKKTKKRLLRLMEIYTKGSSTASFDVDLDVEDEDKVYTTEDFNAAIDGRTESTKQKAATDAEDDLGDQTVRNSTWTLDTETNHWNICPFGILPWQLESMESVGTLNLQNPPRVNISDEFDAVPGLISSQNLTTRSKINWNSVLGKRKKPKRKRSPENVDNVMHRAIKMMKKRA